jgi:hypothetical protein
VIDGPSLNGLYCGLGLQSTSSFGDDIGGASIHDSKTVFKFWDGRFNRTARI